MKIGNEAGLMLGRSRMLRQAKLRAASGERKNTSGRLSGNGGLGNALNSIMGSGSSGVTDTVTALQTKSNYTVIQRSAESLQRYGSKLLATGENSLFGLALPGVDESDEGKAPTEEELAEHKQKVVDEINNFVNDYNTMVERMGQVEDTTQIWYLRELSSYVKENRTKLSALGITQTSNGTLKVNQDKLKEADVERMKQVFGEKGSFADKTSKLAESIGTAAGVGASKALNSGYLGSSNYNRYGTGNENTWYGSGGNWLA